MTKINCGFVGESHHILVGGGYGKCRVKIYRFWGSHRKVKYMKTLVGWIYRFWGGYSEVE